ncbi:MAG: fumarylacetoacetase [Pseudomonadota bacterium]|jgi:fumarylacetoacetase
MLDHTHAADAVSWVPGADTHADFPVQNLPLGVASMVAGERFIATRLGDRVANLDALARSGLLPERFAVPLAGSDLNVLFALPSDERLLLRRALFELFTNPARARQAGAALHAVEDCTMHLPFRIGDYTDFYAGIHHATNIGRLFRPDSPLLPNYKHVPIGYHGRASSVRVSGTSVVRPQGQHKAPQDAVPQFGPCQRLDYELELGVWMAGGNALGVPVSVADAWEHIGGLCLLNDWSARDLQAWEYQPLGPFLAKNFLTSVSPWVVTREALAPFRIPQPVRPAGDPQPLPYLQDSEDQASGALAITVEAALRTATMRVAGLDPYSLSSGPTSHLYWTLAQLVAHHTSNGCNLMPGDLLGTGTISGPVAGTFGSLMEISLNGREPLRLPNGETRTFLEDGDELVLNARAERAGWRSIGFGTCSGTVCAAHGL